MTLKLTINQSALKGVLKHAASIPGTGVMPVLTHLHIEAIAPDKLRVHATDLNMSAVLNVPCVVDTPGEAVVPGKAFADLVAALPAGEIALEHDDKKERMHVEAAGYTGQLSCLPVMEFPGYPQYELATEDVLTVNWQQWVDAWQRVGFSMGQAKQSFGMTGLLVDIADGMVWFITTDRHRMSVDLVSSGAPGGITRQFIISGRHIAKAIALFNVADPVKVYFDSKNMSFVQGNNALVCKLMEDVMPNWRELVPKKDALPVVANVDKDVLAKAIKRVAVLSNEITQGVVLNMKSSDLELRSTESEIGKGSTTVTLNAPVGEYTISFNAHYLLDVFGVIKTQNVMMRFATDNEQAALITPDDSTAHFKHVLMPIS